MYLYFVLCGQSKARVTSPHVNHGLTDTWTNVATPTTRHQVRSGLEYLSSTMYIRGLTSFEYIWIQISSL